MNALNNVNLIAGNNLGIRNVGIGFDSLSNITTGNNNVAVGSNSLSNITTGNNNVGIGETSDQIDPNISNAIIIGNESHQQILIGGKDINQILQDHLLLRKYMKSLLQKY